MGLFKPDLIRNFGIGFALGAAAVVWHIAPNMAQQLVPEAHAATIEATAR